MKPPANHPMPKIREVLFAGVLLLLAIGCNWLVAEHRSGRDISEGLAIAFQFSQLTLAALWLIRGRAWLIARIVPPIAIMQSISWFSNRHQMPMAAMVVFFAMVAVSVVVFSLLRLQRRRLDASEPGIGAHQYSVRRLFEITTGIAVMLAFTNLHRADVQQELGGGRAVRYVAVCACFALLALIGIWSGLGARRHLFGRLALPLVTAFGILFGLSTAFQFGPRDWELFVPLLAQSVFVALPLVVFRYLAPRIAVLSSVSEPLASAQPADESSGDSPISEPSSPAEA